MGRHISEIKRTLVAGMAESSSVHREEKGETASRAGRKPRRRWDREQHRKPREEAGRTKRL